MKCSNCGELLKFTGCSAPNCTAYGCEDCDQGCDWPFKNEVKSRCANAIAEVEVGAWQPVPMAAVMGSFVDVIERVALDERLPVVRTGERDRISPQVRQGVYLRDRGRCQLCGNHAGGGELDHVVPWSAGGSDRSDNLRVACSPCNQRRSNFAHVADAAQPIPVATSCQVCSPQEAWRGAGRLVEAFCMACRHRSSSFAANTI